jgi:SAM-dependent methyltransferase
MSRLLNIGCGGIVHTDWVNLDVVSVAAGVITHDLRRNFPFADGRFDAVYGSHVLEHLEPLAAARLLRDCHRILKPGGIARIVVPDLEAIARLYLESLGDALAGGADARCRYEWAMLELYDQAVRVAPGGAMLNYLRNVSDEHHARFIASRIGDEALAPPATRLPRRVRLARAVAALRRLAARASAFLFLGSEGLEAIREGLFRRTGEVHRWMYDRYSMQHDLEAAGFVDVQVRVADESLIPGFAAYGFETRSGRPRKPDSLYVEGRKCAQS